MKDGDLFIAAILRDQTEKRLLKILKLSEAFNLPKLDRLNDMCFN
ncbi:hypothetical protein LCGC14_0396470 [marine sediment metagenome]|uniref:Uncharacterized protein n=1 Tax=marine sediment metagenome TaxID=412755 RepID=A0A0F9SY57_9ZZZZ